MCVNLGVATETTLCSRLEWPFRATLPTRISKTDILPLTMLLPFIKCRQISAITHSMGNSNSSKNLWVIHTAEQHQTRTDYTDVFYTNMATVTA